MSTNVTAMARQLTPYSYMFGSILERIFPRVSKSYYAYHCGGSSSGSGHCGGSSSRRYHCGGGHCGVPIGYRGHC